MDFGQCYLSGTQTDRYTEWIDILMNNDKLIDRDIEKRLDRHR